MYVCMHFLQLIGKKVIELGEMICYCVSVCESISYNYVCFWIMKNLNSMASSTKKRNDKYNVKQNQEENP